MASLTLDALRDFPGVHTIEDLGMDEKGDRLVAVTCSTSADRLAKRLQHKYGDAPSFRCEPGTFNARLLWVSWSDA